MDIQFVTTCLPKRRETGIPNQGLGARMIRRMVLLTLTISEVTKDVNPRLHSLSPAQSHCSTMAMTILAFIQNVCDVTACWFCTIGLHSLEFVLL